MRAVREGRADEVRKLALEDRSLIDSHDPDCFGAIPLRHAVDRDDRGMVDTLLELGADINGRSDWWAGGFGVLPCDSMEMGEYLLRRGARLNAYIAAGMGWRERLEALLDEDPRQADMKGGDGQRPLHVAKTIETVELLVERGADLEARDTDHGSTPLQYQIESEDICRRLIDLGAQPDIFTACRHGDSTLARAILDQSPNALDAKIGSPPFVSAGSEGGHIYLYKLGDATRPLSLAHREGHGRLVEFLLERATPGQQLLFFCWEARKEAASKLLNRFPDLVSELKSSHGTLPAEAAWEHRTEAVRLMLEIGFDVDVPGAHDSTPLDRAAFHGFVDTIEVLLDSGASVSVHSGFGGTPLETCVYGSIHGWRRDGDYPAAVETLIRAGSEVRPEWVPCGNEAVDAVLRRSL